jgi:hypothetical protein
VGSAIYFLAAHHADAQISVKLEPYFASLGFSCPVHVNPADHVIAIVNMEFDSEGAGTDVEKTSVSTLASQWASGREVQARPASPDLVLPARRIARTPAVLIAGHIRKTLILMERNMLNYSRNLLAYGVRLGMYGTRPMPFSPSEIS